MLQSRPPNNSSQVNRQETGVMPAHGPLAAWPELLWISSKEPNTIAIETKEIGKVQPFFYLKKIISPHFVLSQAGIILNFVSRQCFVPYSHQSHILIVLYQDKSGKSTQKHHKYRNRVKSGQLNKLGREMWLYGIIVVSFLFHSMFFITQGIYLWLLLFKI